jgi:site-specific DNA-methyltransferase (adenine-specific)
MEPQTTVADAPVHAIVPLPSLPLDRIICGDNCEVMRTLPSESIDLVVTSPPYDDLRTYGGHAWDFYGVAWNLKRLLKPGGVIVWVVNDETKDGGETGTSWRQAHHFQSIGLKIHDTMIYQHCKPFPESTRYHPAFEYMFVFSKGKPKVFNPIKDRKTSTGGAQSKSTMERQPDGKIRRPEREFVRNEYASRLNIWDIPAGWGQSTKDYGAFEHPAIFPEGLARDHIVSWSNEGDVVLDPFSGSGTTAKMAKHNGRHYIGIEVNPEYVEISQQRLAQGVLF